MCGLVCLLTFADDQGQFKCSFPLHIDVSISLPSVFSAGAQTRSLMHTALPLSAFPSSFLASFGPMSLISEFPMWEDGEAAQLLWS